MNETKRFTQILRGRPVTSEEAHEAVNRLVARAHNGPGPKSTMSIPVQASDDDVLLTDYLLEVEAEAALAKGLYEALRAECSYCEAGHAFEDGSEKDYDSEYPRHYFFDENVQMFIWRFCHIEGWRRKQALAAIAAYESHQLPTTDYLNALEAEAAQAKGLMVALKVVARAKVKDYGPDGWSATRYCFCDMGLVDDQSQHTEECSTAVAAIAAYESHQLPTTGKE